MNNYLPEESAFLVAFGYRLRTIRLQRNLSQEELADLCGLHRTYIGSIERGERNISILNISRLAKALGCNLSTLMEG
ncbi:helix-turn-helix domain-containing protein [Alkalimonas mucilaginosa]|uniref:Helix-turn-helix transcriptional regulator n=1 Tax=Alkalimonas mucilaginosa TaxID=3057676 RepID=A0ABU7JLV1_9GAMM|nr:helix-turn-helix transcriptional regulator [Alkalimonas sp. MEB004]MEE2026095.1 helix-turn-helix transcriptional regulator [Alkalimonas sp. MEB004]